MTFRLHLDEDTSSGRLYKALRNRDVDVTTTAAAGLLGESDEVQLKWAYSQQRVLYSFNVGDFCRIHAKWLSEGEDHSGIILGRHRYSIGFQLKGLLLLSSILSEKEMQDRIEFL